MDRRWWRADDVRSRPDASHLSWSGVTGSTGRRPSSLSAWRSTYETPSPPERDGLNSPQDRPVVDPVRDAGFVTWPPSAESSRLVETAATARGRRTNPAHRKMSVAGRQQCPNVPRRIVQGDRSEGASGPPDASISEGEWTRCRVAPTALVCATASRRSGSQLVGRGSEQDGSEEGECDPGGLHAAGSVGLDGDTERDGGDGV